MNILRYAEWMANDTFKTTLWCVENSPLHEAAKKTSITVVTIPRHRKYFAFGKAWLLSRKLKMHKVDIAWIRDTRDIDTCGLAVRINGHAKLVYQQAMQLGIDKRDLFHTMRFKRIDLWISTLQFLADQVKKRTRFPQDRIAIVPLSIDTQKFQNRIPNAVAKDMFGIPIDAITMGIVGRIDPLKGQEFVIRAHAELVNEGYPMHLLIVGEPTRNEGDDYFNLLKTLPKDLGSDKYVVFSPFRTDIETAYAAMDVFIMPSQGETFGMVTIEAMASGLPVLGTNSSGTPEILGYGNHGLLYDPGDSETFKMKMKELYGEERRLELGLKGQKFATEHFSRDQVVSKLRTLSIEILD
ncbi:MAG: glycosyltransferase [Cryomorphaceae bacterium]|nr:glycosyltransferase [Cryomorphaceae bacterium]